MQRNGALQPGINHVVGLGAGVVERVDVPQHHVAIGRGIDAFEEVIGREAGIHRTQHNVVRDEIAAVDNRQRVDVAADVAVATIDIDRTRDVVHRVRGVEQLEQIVAGSAQERDRSRVAAGAVHADGIVFGAALQVDGWVVGLGRTEADKLQRIAAAERVDGQRVVVIAAELKRRVTIRRRARCCPNTCRAERVYAQVAHDRQSARRRTTAGALRQLDVLKISQQRQPGRDALHFSSQARRAAAVADRVLLRSRRAVDVVNERVGATQTIEQQFRRAAEVGVVGHARHTAAEIGECVDVVNRHHIIAQRMPRIFSESIAFSEP